MLLTKRHARIGHYLLLILFAAPAARPRRIEFQAIERGTLEGWVTAPPATNRERGARLRQLFAEAGCDTSKQQDQAVKGTKFANIICTLEGESGQTLVIGAHYDKVADGQGAVDNWSGTVLLPALYRSLSAQPRRHRILFVGFAEEEKGLLGSAHFVKQIPKAERSTYSAMINMDSLGLSWARVWHQRSHPKLRGLLEACSTAMGLPFGYVDVQNVGNSDSASFHNAKIPVIDFHSLTPETLATLHSRHDQPSALKLNEYWRSYRLIAGFVALLDTQLEVGR